MSQIANGAATGSKGGVPDSVENGNLARGGKLDPLQETARGHQPIGYVTADYLSALWEERSRQVDLFRQARPNDLREIEQRQRLATQALQAYRLLSELERQLGFELALPVLGPWRGPDGGRSAEGADLID
jgi:hypothetical protein